MNPLSVFVNETVSVINDYGDGWAEVSKANGDSGLVPTNYLAEREVEVKSPTGAADTEVDTTSSSERKRSSYDFEATEDGQLRLGRLEP